MLRDVAATIDEGVYELDAKLDLTLPDGARKAVESGLTLRLTYEVSVDRVRRYMPDAGIAALEQRYEVSYHALSQRYLVKNLNTGEQQDFGSLQGALDRVTDCAACRCSIPSLVERRAGLRRTHTRRARDEHRARRLRLAAVLDRRLERRERVENVDAAALKRAATAVTMGLGGLLWLAAILFMAQTAQNSEQFSRLHPWILAINIAGLVVLVGLLATKLTQLVRDWRGHVIGSRLKARMVWIFGVLATLPILLVYFFSVQFLNRGIDSWFNVEIRKSLDDALVLSRSALEVRMREHLARLGADRRRDRRRRVRRCRACSRRCAGRSGALELTVATESGRVIAVSKGLSSDIVPEDVPDEVLLQVRQGQPFVSLEPQQKGGYLIRTAVPIGDAPGPAASAWCCSDLSRSPSDSARWPTPCRRPTSSSARSTTCASRSRPASS